ncbi:GGDEF domain-containing protein [uncultured Paraglaciecola sp.]|uniref:tetratricopeptide repeat-containing diguanylate cyclase n=1 Tax=uncultured Paraglaciecola sp. TaxID=1765024 RepID=UPI002594477F|nr:GGDEF domain-containing protein [uncultured Paraglaciecola sp.]
MNLSFYLLRFLILFLSFVTIESQASYSSSSSINQHIDHVEQLSINDPNVAIDYIERILQTDKLALSELESSKLKINLIENYLLINKLEKSQVLIKEVDKVYLQFDVSTQFAFLLVKLTYYSYSGQVHFAEQSLIEVEKKSELVNDLQQLSNFHHIKGEFHRNNFDDVRATEAFLKAYELSRLNGDPLNVAYIESSLAKSYASLYDFETAVDLMINSLSYFDEHNLHFDRSTSHYYLARFYLKTKQPQSALEHASKMITINEELANPSLNYYSYILSAKAFFDLGQLENARAYLDLANQYTSNVEGITNVNIYSFTKAEIEIGEGRLADALVSLNNAKKSLELVPSEITVELKLELYRLLSKLYAQNLEFENAYQYKVKYVETNELYNGHVREAARARQQVVYNFKKVKYQNQLLEKDKRIKDFELAKARQQDKIQQIVIISGLLIVISLLVFAVHQFKLRRRFTNLANTDSLTGLSSRFKTMSMLKIAWKRHKILSLISFDIDHFKHVNDRFGHPAGDLVLQKISLAAKQCLRSDDSIGRIGGEEFLIVLNDTPINEAQEIAERIRQDIEDLTINYNELKIQVTASFGVLCMSTRQASYKEMLKLADIALYKAKNLGRNRVMRYDKEKTS